MVTRRGDAVQRISKAFGLLLLAIMCGCGKDQAALPSAPSPTPAAPAVPQQNLSGYVSDTASRTVGGVKIDVVDGPRAGTSIVSGANGMFALNGDFSKPVTIRASKDGYIPLSRTTQVSAPGGRPWIYFQLEVLAAPVTLTGDYTLTFVADSACSDIPSELRTRSYPAAIAPEANAFARPNTFYTLVANGASFITGHSTVHGAVAGDYATFFVYQGEDFGLVEQIADQTFLGFYGEGSLALGTPPAAPITVPFSGIVDYCVQKPGTGWNDGCNSAPPVAHGRCQSQNHRLVLTRR